MSTPTTSRRRLTPDLIHAAAYDAGNRSMRAAGRSSWSRDDYDAAVREYSRLAKPAVEPAGVRHTSCRHCGQDIEGLTPYRRGEWRDRGNSTHCPTPAGDAGQRHAPVKD